MNWPTGIGLSGNMRWLLTLRTTPGAIGFVELVYAMQNQLTYASIKNAAANYIKASPDSITAALASAAIPDDFRISMVNAPGADSYQSQV